jgi:hypothetical protein
MSTAAIVINVRDHEYTHSNGLSGTWVVPAKKANEPCAILIVYPREEIQDQGDRRGKIEVVDAKVLARSIVGHGSNSGPKEKWGLLICEAEPEIPRDLISAIRDEANFINKNRAKCEYTKDSDSGAIVIENTFRPGVAEKLEEFSQNVQVFRSEFEDSCRKLVQKSEIAKAKHNLQMEDQALVAQGDKIWAGPEPGRINISEIHTSACARLGQERPWAYVPQQLVDCPGCGAKIKENILSCPQCSGWLDEGIEELRAMKPKDRAMKMYPERYADPMQASGTKQPRA